MNAEQKRRTLAQNRYRWGCVVDTILEVMNKELEEEGCQYRLSPDDVDLFIKENALNIAHRIPTSIGEFIIKGHLRTRSPGEFEEAMEQIRCYFANTKKKIIIPLPNEDIRDLEEQYSDNLSRL